MDTQLQIAIITNDSFRVEEVGKIVKQYDWQVDACIEQPNLRDWLRRNPADLALVDLDIPDAINRLRKLAESMPSLPLVALVTPQHLVELQDALSAGASSFVAFPLDVNQFATAVMRAVQDGPRQKNTSRKGQVVALTGLKGGVGRSTLAVNMAVALRQRQSEEVILVEGHHGLSDISLMLNLLPRHNLASLAEESEIDLDIMQGHLETHSSKIQVLAAPPDLEHLVELPVSTWRLMLDYLTELAPYVIVDTAAVADPILSEVLTRADDILVVTGPDLASLRSGVVLLQTLDDEENVQANIHVVLNRAGVRGGVSVGASEKQVGEKITAAIPDDPSLVTFAMNRGVPFVSSHSSSIISRQLNGLVEHVFGPAKLDKVEEGKKRSFGSFVPFLGNKTKAA